MTAAGYGQYAASTAFGVRANRGLGFPQPYGPWGYVGVSLADQYGFNVPETDGPDQPAGPPPSPGSLPAGAQAAAGQCLNIVMDSNNAQFATSTAGIGEGGGRGAVAGHGGAEGGEDDGAGDPGVGGDGQGQPGVIIEPGQDLGAGAAGERVAGEVGLPAFVRLSGLKAQVRGSGPLGRVGDHQAGPAQVPADGGWRDTDLVMVFQVPGDGVRPGARALAGQFLAQPGDQLDGIGADRGRGGLRPPGPRFERGLAFGLIAGQQGADPGPGCPVAAGHLADRAFLDHRSDHRSPIAHPAEVPGRGHDRTGLA
jgi:hypothetical protein